MNIILGSWYVINSDLVFHTDIARDFLVIQEMVQTQKPTLIGPRAGGIPGMFHGPLWFYINLPAFILGQGNPIMVGWFWVLLSILSLIIIYHYGKMTFNKEVALLSTLLFSVFLINYTSRLFNSYGSVMLFPVFFYLFSKYIKKLNIKYLLSSLFVLGLIIQFQVGFGPTILVLTITYLIPFLLKRKKLNHLLSLAILIIPLSTFIVFELRHDFLQIRALINFFTSHGNSANLTFIQLIIDRLQGFLLNGLGIIPYNKLFVFPVTAMFVWLFLRIKNQNLKFKDEYHLYFYFYSGFWVLMLLFKGTIYGFFYWGFLPVTILVISSLIMLIDKKLFFLLFVYIYLFNFFFSIQSLSGVGTGWRTYYDSAKAIYRDANKNEFGYYVYSPDLYGYSQKYAISYTQQEFPNTQANSFTKKRLTYLTFESPPLDRPWLDGKWWKTNQVRVIKKPNKKFNYPNGVVVEKYLLNQKELEVFSDPNLIQDLIFR